MTAHPHGGHAPHHPGATRRRAALALVVGLLFGAGLALGGMTDPRVVRGFLDVAGAWDPRLAFVMGGALVVSTVGVAIARRRGRPVLADHLQLPTRRDLDPRLILGAAIFGIGWGVAGYCPAPALTAVVINPAEALGFLPAFFAGTWLARRLQ